MHLIFFVNFFCVLGCTEASSGTSGFNNSFEEAAGRRVRKRPRECGTAEGAMLLAEEPHLSTARVLSHSLSSMSSASVSLSHSSDSLPTIFSKAEFVLPSLCCTFAHACWMAISEYAWHVFNLALYLLPFLKPRHWARLPHFRMKKSSTCALKKWRFGWNTGLRC